MTAPYNFKFNIMTKLFLTVVLTAILTSNLTAQQFERKTSKGGGFKIETGTATAQQFKIDGLVYPIFETKSGAKYIKLHSSRTGNDYPLWIGTETGATFEGQPVRKSSKGTFFIIAISKRTKQPYSVYLNTK